MPACTWVSHGMSPSNWWCRPSEARWIITRAINQKVQRPCGSAQEPGHLAGRNHRRSVVLPRKSRFPHGHLARHLGSLPAFAGTWAGKNRSTSPRRMAGRNRGELTRRPPPPEAPPSSRVLLGGSQTAAESVLWGRSAGHALREIPISINRVLPGGKTVVKVFLLSAALRQLTYTY